MNARLGVAAVRAVLFSFLCLPLGAYAVITSNHPPVAVGDVITVPSGSTNNINVLANDFDPDGDVLSISGFTQPSFGSVYQSGQQLVYQSFTPYCGPDSFTYTISDGHGGFANTNVSVSVNCGPSNDPPVAVDDFVTVASGVSTLIDVLTNDYDPDFNPISIWSYGQPAHGSVFQSGGLYYQSFAGYSGPDSFGYMITDNNGGFSGATVSITVTNGGGGPTNPPASADVSLTKYSSWSNNVQVGQQIIYTLSAFNSGPAFATNVVIHDTIPNGVSYVSASGGACAYNSGTRTVDCSVGSLSSSGQATVYVTVQVNSTGLLINTANATLDTFDSNLSNNTSSVTNTGSAAQADLSLTKYTSTTNALNIGSQIIYTLGAFNGGPSIASNAVVSDTLPAGVTLVSVTGMANSYSYDTNLNRVDVNLGNLAVAASPTVYLTVQVTAQVGTLLNCASIFSDMSDSNQANNMSCVTNVTTQPTADLQITKTASSNSVAVGSIVVFNLTARNNGPSTITNQIVVTEVIPSGFDYLSDNSSGTGAYYSYGLGQWVMPTGLVANTTKTLAITLRANTNGVFTNIATINVPSDVTDPNTNNNSSSAVVTSTVPQADLQITKTVNSNSVPVGENVVFQLTLVNAGPNDVTNSISVNEAIPPGFQYVSDNSFASGTTYSAGVGLWTIFNGLGSGSNIVLNITMQAVSAGTYTNRAIINVPSGFNDPNTNNNSSSVVVTNTVLPADVQISKTANTNSALQGAPIIFTITASNLGPNTASNVVVQDTVPVGVTVTASNVPPGTIYNSAAATWTIPSLANGAATSLQLTMTRAAAGTVTNVAAIISTATSDPNPNNNTNSATVTWATTNSADLGIRITLSTNVVLQGGVITVEFAVTNLGPQDASNIMIYAPVPPGTVFVSQGGSLNWNYNFATGVWTRNGFIVAGFEYYLGFDLRATNSGAIAVVAAITNSSPTDVITNNNFASTNFTVIAVVNLSGSARQCTNNGSIMPGVTITLTTTNGFALTNVTDASGNYSFTNLLPGFYTITPSSNGFGFTPANYTLNAPGGTTNFPPFVAIPRTISGSVLTGTNTLGVPGITIQLSGAANATMLTGTNGAFTFTNLNPGNYTITPLTNGVPGARFTPTNATYALGDPTNCSRTLTFYLTNTLIVLRAIEVNQAVQDWQNSVPVVKSKPTLVRVFLQLPGTNTTPVTVSNAMLKSTFGSLTGATFVVWTNDVSTDVSRTNLNGSMNFNLPPNWINGNVELRFEWKGGVVLNQEPLEARGGGVGSNGAVVVNFAPMPAVSVKWVNVATVTNVGGVTNILSAASIDELQNRLKAIYPVASVNARRVDMMWTRAQGAPFGATEGTLSDLNSVIAFMRVADVLFNNIGWANDPLASKRLYYGTFDDDLNVDGGGIALGIPGDVSCGGLPSSPWVYGRNRHAHEMGHSLGRYHSVYRISGTRKIGDFGEVAPTNAPTFPFLTPSGAKQRSAIGPVPGTADTIVYGWDGNARIVVNPFVVSELMSYVKPGWRWISSYTYTNIQNALVARFGAGGAAALPGPKVGPMLSYRMVRGIINYAQQTIQMKPFYTLTPATPFPTPTPGPYSVRCYDGANTLITEIPFEPEDLDPDSPENGDPSALIMVPVPEDPAIDHIEIWQNGNLAITRHGSAHPPTVHVLSPNGGEAFGSGMMNISWQGSDLDGDPLTYVVQYSFDGGTSWDTLAADWDGTSLQVDTTTLPASTQGRIRVIASDSFDTASDMSDGNFTVLNHAPAIAITTPSNGDTFVADQQLVLNANANDADDGPLSGTNVVWNSSLNGFLGTDTTLVLSANLLSEGTHVITATAIDSGGLTNSASINVVVSRDNPPLLNIALNNPNVLLWWSTNSTNYHLQRALSLPGSWSDVTNSTTVVSNQVQVTLPANGAAKFYRLTKP